MAMLGGIVSAFQYCAYAYGVREHLYNSEDQGTVYIPAQAAGNRARLESAATGAWIAAGGLVIAATGYLRRKTEGVKSEKR
jgi:hypothetical protein